jgi:acetolactate synthase-1/2/3 large subunit
MLTRATGRAAVRSLNAARHYATQPSSAAANGTRRAVQAGGPKSVQEQSSKRPKSTVTATATKERPIPAPAFNRDESAAVEPLKTEEETQLDHSFVGMTGGEIFHEMMLRQGVDTICESTEAIECAVC